MSAGRQHVVFLESKGRYEDVCEIRGSVFFTVNYFTLPTLYFEYSKKKRVEFASLNRLPVKNTSNIHL